MKLLMHANYHIFYFGSHFYVQKIITVIKQCVFWMTDIPKLFHFLSSKILRLFLYFTPSSTSNDIITFYASFLTFY